MTMHATETRAPRKTWPFFTLREKRVRLVEEQLGALVVEARMLGIDRTELTDTLRRFYGEES